MDTPHYDASGPHGEEGGLLSAGISSAAVDGVPTRSESFISPAA